MMLGCRPEGEFQGPEAGGGRGDAALFDPGRSADAFAAWEEAVLWAMGPDGDGVIETELPVEDGWLEALPDSKAWVGVRLLGGGLGMSGLQALGRHRPSQLVVREVGWGAAELAEIRRWGSLERLDIESWEGGEEELLDLRGLETLRSLRLAGNKRTCVDWTSLEGLTELRHLHLLGIVIGDEALRGLGGLEDLESLYLDDAGCSPETIAALLRLNPDLHLHWEGGHF